MRANRRSCAPATAGATHCVATGRSEYPNLSNTGRAVVSTHTPLPTHTHVPTHTPAPTHAAMPLHFVVPHGIYLHEAACVAVDSADRVVCFNRGSMPLMIFDASGRLLNVDRWNGTRDLFAGYDPYESGLSTTVRWSASEFVKPHGLTIDENDDLWLVDVGAHVVTHCTMQGDRRLMLLPGPRAVTDPRKMRELIGEKQVPALRQSGKAFNQPCNVAVQRRADGHVFVCDGYGNSRVHCFRRSDGAHVRSWGTSGTRPGEFNLPHDAAVLHRHTTNPMDDRLLVADRENHRVQLFALDGTPLRQWHVHRPCGIALSSDESRLYVAQLAAGHVTQRTGGQASTAKWTRNIGNCVSIHSPETGLELGRIAGDVATDAPTGMLEPHGVAVARDGRVYTASVSFHREGVYRKPVPYILATLKAWQPVERA